MRAPLNCVGKSILALHGKNTCMVIHWILTIEGKVDPVRLGRSLSSVLDCHPPMKTSVHGRCPGKTQEDPEEHALCFKDMVMTQGWSGRQDKQIEAQYENLLSEWINRPLDPRKEPPFRVLLLRKREAESSLTFTFHHCSADGIRSLRFVRDVIETYNSETEDPSPTANTSVPRKGDELLRLARAQRSRVEHFYAKMVSSLFRRFFVEPFSPPTRIFNDRCERLERVDFCYGNINARELRQVRSTAKLAGATTNDVLLAACFRTVERWNDLHGKGSKRISIMVPVDVGADTLRHAVSNQVSFLSLSTMPEDRVDPAYLLRTVRVNRAYMLENGIAFSVVFFLYFCSLLPMPVMKLIARFLVLTRIYADTVLVTNVGSIQPKGPDAERAQMRIGDSAVIDILGLPPVPSPMVISFYAGTYCGNLCVCAAYRRSRMSREKSGELLRLYLDEVRSYGSAVDADEAMTTRRHLRRDWVSARE
jgi:NRPS condensation-like uncharacterized protein